VTAPAVLDASAAIHLVMAADHAGSLAERLEKAVSVSAPDLFCSEVGNALWKYVKLGSLSLEQAGMHLEEALSLVDGMAPSDSLVHEALVAAARYGHPVYDVMYAVLARRHGAAVLTMDRGLAGLLRRMEIDVYCPVEKVP
jgi:predicted nucleic acid-binding protein